MEGEFFVWTPDEIRDVLGDEADAFMAAYGVTRHCNASTGSARSASTNSAHGSEGKSNLEFVGDFTCDDHESLITRRHDLQDSATPSGNAMAVTALFKLGGFTNELTYVDIAHQALAQMQTPSGGGMMSQYPLGFGQWLQSLSYTLAKPKKIAIAGDPQAAHTQALLSVVRDGYQPYQVVALGSPSTEPSTVPLLQDRGLVEGRAAAYVCRDFACQAPVQAPDKLQAQLALR